jgi:archaemetzincin
MKRDLHAGQRAQAAPPAAPRLRQEHEAVGARRLIPIAELVLLPFEGMPAAVVEMLAAELRSRGVATRIDATVPLPSAAYDRARGQYRAEPLLALASGQGARHLLAITHRDLFAGGLNFVFGIASPRGACVVSAARLLAGADDALFRARLVKEAVHELGHTLGLEHCADAGCVMHFSNSLADTDRKGDAYCRRCAARLRSRSS